MTIFQAVNGTLLPFQPTTFSEAGFKERSDLQHLLKSLKHTEYTATITPALCRKCGFEFSPDKLRKPSRCPTCHSTWLTEPGICFTKG